MIRIAQISDVHIRCLQRHKEYLESFENLYASLREKKVDLICVAGDILHQKLSLSPELVQMTTGFFRSLADIAPTVIIPGNHDHNLSNLSRLDALTPIVDALDHPKLVFLKQSQVFSLSSVPAFTQPYSEFPNLEDVEIAVFSCFDEDWPTKNDVSEHKITIGIFHGMVKGAVFQNGMVYEDCPHTVEQFLEIVDYLHLGDIHRKQIFAGYRAAYCGSTIQQGFAEQVDKGYLIWDIESKDKWEVDFVKLPNVCPYYTLELPDDLILDTEIPLQTDARIRIVSRQLTVIEEQELRKQVNEVYKPKELFFKDKENAHLQELKISEGVKIEDLADLGVQEKLIHKFLQQYDESYDLEKIYELNRRLDAQVKNEEDTIRNVQYKYKKMRWDNLFSYGEGNEIDFTKYKGIVGILGSNAVGKSSCSVDIPLYVQFNTNSKQITKNAHLVNERRTEGFGEIEIEVGKKTYKIKRKTAVNTVRRKGQPVQQGVTTVEFKIYDEDGNEIEDKMGEQRRDTDKEIRKVFGTSEDFMSTSLAPQWRLLEFIEKKSADRQKTLGRYFDVDAFPEKHKLANEESKDLKAELRVLDRRNLEGTKDAEIKALEKIERELQAFEGDREFWDKKVSYLDEQILSWSSQIVPLGFGCNRTASEVEKEILATKVQCINKSNEIENLENDLKTVEKKLIDAQKVRMSINHSQVSAEIDRWKKKKSELSTTATRIASHLRVVRSLDSSLEEMNDHVCAENVKCCLFPEKERILSERTSEANLAESLATAQKKNSKAVEATLTPLEEELERYNSVTRTCLLADKERETHVKLISSGKALFDKMVKDVDSLKVTKKDIIDHEDQLKKNVKCQKSIDSIKPERTDFVKELDTAKKNIASHEAYKNAKIQVLKGLETEIESYQSVKDKYSAYEYYLRAVGKEGIPRLIVHNNLDLINKQVRKILRGNVDFVIELESTGKEIEIFFKHGKSKKRRIENCSGMEKTICAIALRAAMVSVTTLPRANIFVLDEVFSSLDPEYTESVRKILHYLKNLFDSVIVITHLEEFKDMVDHVIEVTRDDEGFARIS